MGAAALLVVVGAFVTSGTSGSPGALGPLADVVYGAGGEGTSPEGGAEPCAAPCANVALQLPQAPGTGGVGTNLGYTIHSPPYNGAEPTIGVSSDGTEIYIQIGLNTVRSTDSGSTWTEIGSAWTNVITLDPMLYYDNVIDRLYANHLTVECTLLAWVDNPSAVSSAITGTASWKFNPHACGLPGIDHQKLEGGPSPTLGAANSGRSLYMGYSQAGGGAMVAKSVDGGFTWVNAVATPSITRGTVLWPTGPVTADPAGTYVYLPHHNPTGGLKVARSSNEGLTYVTGTVSSSAGASGHAVDPEVAVDESGNVFVVWYDSTNHQIYYSYSTDHGVSWSSAVMVSDSASTLSNVFPTAVAKSAGKLDVAYYGTASDDAGPDGCAASGTLKCVWQVHMAQITNATTATPTITRAQVTPSSDPIQIGKICTEGTGCSSGTRNLLDFIDIEVDGSGYAHIAYTDGCTGLCSSSSSGQSTANAGRYARQTSGTTI